MSGVSYDFVSGSIAAVVVTILVFIVSSIIPNEPVAEKH